MNRGNIKQYYKLVSSHRMIIEGYYISNNNHIFTAEYSRSHLASDMIEQLERELHLNPFEVCYTIEEKPTAVYKVNFDY